MATSASPQSGVYIDQHAGRGATMHFDEDGHLDLTSGSIALPGSLGRGYLNIGANLFGGRNAASNETIASGSSAPTAFWGGILMPDGAPALKFLSSGDKVWSLQYASAVVAAVAMLPIPMPNDMSTAGGLTVEFYGESVGTGTASDAKSCLTIVPHFGVGNTSGTPTTHPDFTSTPSWKGITIASGTVTTDSLTLTVYPAAHAGRAIYIYDARISYAKKTS